MLINISYYKVLKINDKFYCDNCNYTCHGCLKNTYEYPDMIYTRWNFVCCRCEHAFCADCAASEITKFGYCQSCDKINYSNCTTCSALIHKKDINKCTDCNGDICNNCSKISYGGDKLCLSCTKEYPVVLSKNDLKKLKPS